jgi:CheY-like chemotaxis protein
VSSKTVLVVDDEPMVRDLLTEVLRLQGCNVLAVASAAEALRVAASTATIHLLITDLMMPEVDGLELTRRFRAMRPNIPVLMVSGSLPLLHARSEPDLERFDFLAKPFQLNELLQKVRELLEVPISLTT